MERTEREMGRARFKRTAMVSCIMLFCNVSGTGWCAKIAYPWRATTAIVKAGESFDVWFVADIGQTVSSVQLKGPYSTVNVTKSEVNGSWVYDNISGNTYNKRITVTVPSNTPEDRYDLVLKTSTGDVTSQAAVKVIKQVRSSYYIMHISDVHRYQGGYNSTNILKRVSAIIDYANIIDPQAILETGDLMYGVDGNPSREAAMYNGISSLGIKGLNQCFAATFMVDGNHDNPTDASTYGDAAVSAKYFNTYHGLTHYNFAYGNGRFMIIANSISANNTAQVNDAKTWLNSVGNGNFRLGAFHGPTGGEVDLLKTQNGMTLGLAGHTHTTSANPEANNVYVASDLRANFQFNLYKVNNDTGGITLVPGAKGYADAIENMADRDTPSLWKLKLTLNYSKSNNGTSTDNTATITNKFSFPIDAARVRFVMPKGNTYDVSGGTVKQEFDGDTVHVVDVAVDLGANSTKVVSITKNGSTVTIPSVSFAVPAGNATVQQGTNLYVKVNATDPDGITQVRLYKNGVRLARTEGGAPYEWCAPGQTDPELQNLQPGSFTLRAEAIDSVNTTGTSSTITITVQSANQAPYFTADPFTMPDATAGTAYSQSISAKAVDPEGGTKTFSKTAGPVWLSLTSAGALQGTPGSVDAGTNSFMVKVTDNAGLSDTATMQIKVVSVQPLPSVGSIITLKAVNGKYVSATYSTNNALIANKTTLSNYERFKVVNATNCVALQCMGNSRFVSIETPDGSKPMVANRSTIGSYEKFNLVQSGTNMAIQSVRSTNYVSAVSNGVAPLRACQTYIGSYEKFTWKVE
jgi:predicted phosphodiesterase